MKVCVSVPCIGEYPRERIETWDWTNIPFNRESMHKFEDKNTIRYRSFDKLRDDCYPINNEDGSGEAADLVCLKEVDEKAIRLCLLQCKGHTRCESRQTSAIFIPCAVRCRD